MTAFDGHPLYRVAPRAPPAASASTARVLYLHGGAYVRPITRHHWNFVVDLVRRTGCEVVVPLYPLAPRHAGLTALTLVGRVYAAEAAAGSPMMVIGDSAGGGLALALAGWIRDQPVSPPALLVLLSPWLDVEIPHPDAVRLQAVDPMLTLDGLRRAGRAYAGPLGGAHPVISPARADPRGLPPMAIHVGGCELLCPDVLDYVARARALGARIELHQAPSMMHVWPLLGLLPEARMTRALVAQQLQAALAERAGPVTRPADRPPHDPPGDPQIQAARKSRA